MQRSGTVIGGQRDRGAYIWCRMVSSSYYFWHRLNESGGGLHSCIGVFQLLLSIGNAVRGSVSVPENLKGDSDCLSFSVFLYLWLPVSLSFFLSVSCFLSPCPFVSLSLRLSVFLYLSLSHCLTVTATHRCSYSAPARRRHSDSSIVTRSVQSTEEVRVKRMTTLSGTGIC